MRNKAWLVNMTKNVVIAILAVSSIALFLLVTRDVVRLTPVVSEPVTESTAEGLMPSSPHVVLLTTAGGDGEGASRTERFAAKYDSESKQRLFAQFSITLGEALGSASAPEETREAQWRRSLSCPGIYLDYLYALPLNLIAEYHGAEISENFYGIAVRRLCLSVESGAVWLNYIDDITGSFYRLSTAIGSDSFLSRLSAADMQSARFAYENKTDVLSGIDPYFVYSSESIVLSEAQSVAPVLTAQSGLVDFSVFEMNERSAVPFEEDSDTVFVEGYKTLRVRASGSLIFSATNAEGIEVVYSGRSPTLYDMVLSASAIVSGTIAPYCGEAEIGLTEIERESGGYTLTYGYYVDGVPVRVSSTGWCAKIRISGTRITRAELFYRTYTLQSTTVTPFPENQNAVISAANGGSPLLMYEDALGALKSNWYTIK